MSDSRRPVRGAAAKATAKAAAQLGSGRASPSKATRRPIPGPPDAPDEGHQGVESADSPLSPLSPGTPSPPPPPPPKKKGGKGSKRAKQPVKAPPPVVEAPPPAPPPHPPTPPPRPPSPPPPRPPSPPPPRTPTPPPRRTPSPPPRRTPSPPPRRTPSPPHRTRSPPPRRTRSPSPLSPTPSGRGRTRSLPPRLTLSPSRSPSPSRLEEEGEPDVEQPTLSGSKARLGRRPDALYEATRATNQRLAVVLDAACAQYGYSADTFVRAFLRERDYKERSDSNWNAFQAWEAEQNRLDGVVVVPRRSEVSVRFRAFKEANENWQEILDAYRDVKEVEKSTKHTYFQKQRELEKLHEMFTLHAERAHLLNFEVMFAIVGSAILQNDALNRLYYTPGLVNFATSRLDVPDDDFLGLIMTEACDDVSKSTTRHIKRHIAGSVAEDDPSETKRPSSSVTIVTKPKPKAPNPADVVLASGRTLTLPIPRDTLTDALKYEKNVAFMKSLVEDVIHTAKLRIKISNQTTWGQLPTLLAEAGWCLLNYPAGIPMPGEIPENMANQQGIRVLKRGQLSDLVAELMRVGSPDWVLVEGDIDLMMKSLMPVIIEASPILLSEHEKKLLSWKKGKSPEDSKAPPPPTEFGRRMYCNFSIDELGPRYIVDDVVSAARAAARAKRGDDDDDSGKSKKKKSKSKRAASAAPPTGSSGHLNTAPPLPDTSDVNPGRELMPPPPPPPPSRTLDDDPGRGSMPPPPPPTRTVNAPAHNPAPLPSNTWMPSPSTTAPSSSHRGIPPPQSRGSSYIPPPQSARGNVAPPQQHSSVVTHRPLAARHGGSTAPPPRPPSRATMPGAQPRPPSRAASVQPSARPPSRAQGQAWQQVQPVTYPAPHRPTPHFAPGVASRGNPSQPPSHRPSSVTPSTQPYTFQSNHADVGYVAQPGPPFGLTSRTADDYDGGAQAIKYASGNHPADDGFGQGAGYGPTDDEALLYNEPADYDEGSQYNDGGYDRVGDGSDYHPPNYPYTQHHLSSIPETYDQSDGAGYQDQGEYYTG